ncbi:hypothetical protein AAE478_002923 [Parahypoxylon ruwenzoriense]
MLTKPHSAAAILAAFTAVTNGHMIMQNPKPFGGPDLDNSPLTSSNYPCKLKGDPASFYKKDGLDNTMAVGESQTLSFKGSAVHGGGSCQLAITSDPQPSASTSWQVILSIEGGCPSKSGQGADTYDWKIPEGVMPGDYVFAWTWISKLAGQPEYYMNCAPITVTGGKSRRRSANESEVLLAPRDAAFPELFVANLAEINDCKTEPSTDPEYPDPGPNVERPGTNNKFAKVQGSNCVPKGAKQGAKQGASAGSGSGSGSGSSGADSGSSGSGSSTPQTGSTGSGSGAANNMGSNSGSSSNSGSGSGASPSSAAAAAPSGFITSVVSSSSSSSAAPAVASSAAPAGSSSGASSGPPGTSPGSGSGSSSGSGSGSAGGLTGACSSEGMFNCIGGTSYQQCASGSWSVVMQMPATVKCQEGQTMTLWGRDERGPRRMFAYRDD